MECTLADWMDRGPLLVGKVLVDSVRIMGRRPTRVQDKDSPAGEYGWQYGWRWKDDTAMASHTLPEALFEHLPECPNLEVVRLKNLGRGVMPRWPTEGEALAALDLAAFTWAKTQAYISGRRAEVDALRERIGPLVAAWVEATAPFSLRRLKAGHETARAIVALGPQAVPLLEDLLPQHPALRFVIEEMTRNG